MQIEELGGGGTEEGRAMAEKLKWSAVLNRAQGVKVRTRTHAHTHTHTPCSTARRASR